MEDNIQELDEAGDDDLDDGLGNMNDEGDVDLGDRGQDDLDEEINDVRGLMSQNSNDNTFFGKE